MKHTAEGRNSSEFSRNNNLQCTMCVVGVILVTGICCVERVIAVLRRAKKRQVDSFEETQALYKRELSSSRYLSGKVA